SAGPATAAAGLAPEGVDLPERTESIELGRLRSEILWVEGMLCQSWARSSCTMGSERKETENIITSKKNKEAHVRDI
ncbi:MAG: hypothetical protein ABJN51_01675, partial [Sneathiella sp.]